MFVPPSWQKAKLPETRQDAKNGPSLRKAPPDAPKPAEGTPEPKWTPEMHAREGWRAPSAEELQATLVKLLHAHGNQNSLKDGIRSIENGGNLGRFFSAEDWRVIAWAVNAWAILPVCIGELRANKPHEGYGLPPLPDEIARFVAGCADDLCAKASRRAASIWRE